MAKGGCDPGKIRSLIDAETTRQHGLSHCLNLLLFCPPLNLQMTRTERAKQLGLHRPEHQPNASPLRPPLQTLLVLLTLVAGVFKALSPSSLGSLPLFPGRSHLKSHFAPLFVGLAFGNLLTALQGRGAGAGGSETDPPGLGRGPAVDGLPTAPLPHTSVHLPEDALDSSAFPRNLLHVGCQQR